MVFSKSSCPACKAAKGALESLDIPYDLMELDKRDDGQEIQVSESGGGRKTLGQELVSRSDVAAGAASARGKGPPATARVPLQLTALPACNVRAR